MSRMDLLTAVFSAVALALSGCGVQGSTSTKGRQYGGLIAAADTALYEGGPVYPADEGGGRPSIHETPEKQREHRQMLEMELGRYQAPPQYSEYPPYSGGYYYDPSDFYYNNYYYNDPDYQPFYPTPPLSKPVPRPNDYYQGYTTQGNLQ